MLFSYDCSLEVLLPFVRILLLSSTTSLQSLGRLYEPPGISPGRVETSIRRGGQLRCGCFANLLQYLRATNYQNIMRFDKVTAKTERVQFFCPKPSTPWFDSECRDTRRMSRAAERRYWRTCADDGG